ncbi:MAG: glycoside hydrolase family 13 protein, partial [Clostridia bacterium]|nr:glycoside hydrolase family 13 protein [Clostridia bacterium]
MITYFDSKQRKYKNPVGAVCQNTTVHLRISLPRDLKCHSATLIVKEDFSGSTQTFSMFWCGQENDYTENWECHFTPNSPGL